MSAIKTTERGWPGHFVSAAKCLYRRNTLVELGPDRVVVSTVGNYRPSSTGPAEEIGWGRFFETMVFAAVLEDSYWEADASKQLCIDGALWMISESPSSRAAVENDVDKMHDVMVAQVAHQLLSGSLDTQLKGDNAHESP